MKNLKIGERVAVYMCESRTTGSVVGISVSGKTVRVADDISAMNVWYSVKQCRRLRVRKRKAREFWVQTDTAEQADLALCFTAWNKPVRDGLVHVREVSKVKKPTNVFNGKSNQQIKDVMWPIWHKCAKDEDWFQFCGMLGLHNETN